MSDSNIKGIIDSAPEINVASIEPSGFATMVYDSEGNKHVYYADVSVLKDGMEAVTSSHHLRPNQLRKKIKERLRGTTNF